MEQTIDCLLIGHNEMDFEVYEKSVKDMGTSSGAYRDLNLSFLHYNDNPYTVSMIFNLFNGNDNPAKGSVKPVGYGETFSAAVAYLGTYLHKRGFTFDYINSFQSGKEELAQKLKTGNICTIAITTTLYVSVFPILEIIDFIKRYNRAVKIIVGGPFVSTKVRTLSGMELQYLFNTISADFYVDNSQGESTLVNLIRATKNNLPLEKIDNIYYKTANDGVYTATPYLKENNRLSENLVDWSLFSHNPAEYVNIRTAISCPFSCSFCGFPRHAGEYQTAAALDIERELTGLQKIKKVKGIHFIDDTFNVPAKRFKEILKMMIKNRFNFSWHSYFRCQYADRETLDLMKESGCEGVFWGLESGNEQILKNMNKTADLEKYLRGIALLKEYDIVTFGSFIVGFPGETYETVQDTIQLIEQSEIDFYRAQPWYCEPITPIWHEREKYNIAGSHFEWSHETMDYKEACDLIDEILVSIDKSTWTPQYDFDFDTIFHLMHRGMSLEQVKYFLNGFSQGIKEKLIDPDKKNVSPEVLMKLKESCLIYPPACSGTG